METGLHHLLIYDYVEDVLERRGPYREEHLALLRRAKEEGLVAAAGALGDPPTGAAIVVCGGAGRAEALAAADPYVRAGIVRSWGVVPWNVVV